MFFCIIQFQKDRVGFLQGSAGISLGLDVRQKLQFILAEHNNIPLSIWVGRLVGEMEMRYAYLVVSSNSSAEIHLLQNMLMGKEKICLSQQY